MLGYYGADPARPVVKHYGVDLSRASYSAVVGIQFVASQRNPRSADFVDFNTSVTGLHALGGHNNSVVGGLLIEDCWFDWFSGNILQSEYSDNIVYNVVGGNPLITFLNASTQTGVKFFANEVQGTRLLLDDLTESGVFRDNYYASTLDQSKWFAATGTTYVSLADYRTRSGDTTSIAGTRPYVDPNRTIETYLASLGYSTNMDSLVAELVRQSKFNWRPPLTADAINSYIRGGFCVAGSTSCR